MTRTVRAVPHRTTITPPAVRAVGRHASALTALAILAAAPAAAQDAERGRVVYERWCAGCHGTDGAGEGPAAAFMLPRPRDFTGAVYQIRTTASGELPTDADLRHVIDVGMPGTAMPGWRAKLTEQQRHDVTAYLKSFSRFFDGAQPEPLEFGRAPRLSEEGVEEGRGVYTELECFRCHGEAGRGDGASAPTLTDDWGFPIRTADLTEPWAFNGGSGVQEIYRRMRTGLDGTPMPSFSDVIASGIITEEQLWRVAQYVASLAPGRNPPRVREVIRAALTEGDLPAGPADTSWQEVEPFYIPLVGQIIVSPRWFAPSVDGLWVQALHNAVELALRITWHDPSRSPDPAWQEWVERIADTMTDVDGPVDSTQGPDLLTVQFPMRRAEGMERPYFLGGDARRPVYLWRWRSTPDEIAEGTATGLGTFAAVPASDLGHQAQFDRGAWTLQIRRSLVPRDSGAAPEFTTGEAIPVAFFASDGSNGEDAMRSAVSTWYAIYLDVPTPTTVYVLPVVAAMLTAGLGVLVVARAQRRARAP